MGDRETESTPPKTAPVLRAVPAETDTQRELPVQAAAAAPAETDTQRELPAQPAAAAPAAADLGTYAEWFVWGRRQGLDVGRCHAVAQAAERVVVNHGEGGAVEQAARTAMNTAHTPEVDPEHQAYTAWFAVANLDLGFDTARSHRFAEAGSEAQRQGADIAAATRAAEAAAGQPGS